MFAFFRVCVGPAPRPFSHTHTTPNTKTVGGLQPAALPLRGPPALGRGRRQGLGLRLAQDGARAHAERIKKEREGRRNRTENVRRRSAVLFLFCVVWGWEGGGKGCVCMKGWTRGIGWVGRLRFVVVFPLARTGERGVVEFMG